MEEKERKNLSTAEEIKNRVCSLYGGPAKIYDYEPSITEEDTLIVLFRDGSQANMSHEEFKKL